jgi:hypothetical protein
MPNEPVRQEQVIAAVKQILGVGSYVNMEQAGVGFEMILNAAAVKAFIYQNWPLSERVLRQGLIQLAKDGYLR